MKMKWPLRKKGKRYRDKRKEKYERKKEEKIA